MAADNQRPRLLQPQVHLSSSVANSMMLPRVMDICTTWYRAPHSFREQAQQRLARCRAARLIDCKILPASRFELTVHFIHSSEGRVRLAITVEDARTLPLLLPRARGRALGLGALNGGYGFWDQLFRVCLSGGIVRLLCPV